MCVSYSEGMPTKFRLREILERIEMSQSELARQSGVSMATINRMCTNATGQVSLETLDKIATALGIEPNELIVKEKKGRK